MIFLCANDKLVIKQKPRAILKILHACFHTLLLFYRLQIMKLTHVKYLPYCTQDCAITWYLYINKRILIEKEIMKVTEFRLPMSYRLSIECFAVVAVLKAVS